MGVGNTLSKITGSHFGIQFSSTMMSRLTSFGASVFNKTTSEIMGDKIASSTHTESISHTSGNTAHANTHSNGHSNDHSDSGDHNSSGSDHDH